jgi:hypothetical protein
MLPRLLLAVVLTLGLSTWGYAQMSQQQLRRQTQRNQQQQQQQMNVQPTETDVKGTIESVMRGGIIVLDATSQRRKVFVPATATIEVTGTATADYLQAGQIIELTAEVDDHGAIREKVGEFSIVTLSADKQMGVFPPEAADAGSKLPEGFGGDETGGKPAKAAKAAKPAKHAGGKTGKAPGKGAIAAGNYRIVAKLKVLPGGKYALQTGRGAPLALELTEEPTIKVQSSDYMAAAQGDKISIKGLMMPNRADVVQATEVKIDVAKPLVGTKKKSVAAKSEKHPAKHPKKNDEGLPEQPADK